VTSRERLALQAKLAALGSAPLRGPFYRSVGEAYRYAPLSGLGSHMTGGRYNRSAKYEDSFDALYLADCHDTGLREVGAIVGTVSTPLAPRSLLSIIVDLSTVTDITGLASAMALGVTSADLERDWRIPQIADRTITQEIGRVAFDLGIEGLLVPSTKHVGHANLVIFGDNLFATSRLSVYGSGTGGKAFARDVLVGRR
jgi:RES domain-containing protein